MTINECAEALEKCTTLPCPFCGAHPEIAKHFREEMWRLTHRCAVVGPLTMDWTGSENRLVERWNTRNVAG